MYVCKREREGKKLHRAKIEIKSLKRQRTRDRIKRERIKYTES
jgi:hypothetical protein